MKGVISQADYDQTEGTPSVINASNAERAVRLKSQLSNRVPSTTERVYLRFQTQHPGESACSTTGDPPSDQAASSAPSVIRHYANPLPSGSPLLESGTPAFKVGSIRFTLMASSNHGHPRQLFT